MKVHVLGSAAGGGLPQWNCGGDNSRRARAGDPDVPPRCQPSIAVGAGAGRWSLVNASPDIRHQLARFSGLHPKPGTRDIPLDQVLLTNADLDHVLGLLVLRESIPIPYRVITSAWIRDALLEHNAAFRLVAEAFETVRIGESFDLGREGRIRARFFAVPGKTPGWLSGLAENAAETTLGLCAEDRQSGRRLVYAPGLQALDAEVLRELEAADLRFVDGTFWTNDELAKLRPGAPNAREMGHVPISGPEGSLEKIRNMPGRSFYIHINNSNPILDAASEQGRLLREAGVGIAQDGLEVEP